MLDQRTHDDTFQGLSSSPTCRSRLRAISYGLLLCLLVVGCSNDPERIRELTKVERVPTMSVDSLRLFYRQQGKIQAIVSAPVMLSYDNEEVKYDEFPQGITVESFDEQGKLSSMIQANYAIYQREQKLWDARYRVLAVNEAGDSIQTEQIFWNELTKRVHTTANVRIRTESATLFGRGFESDDRFENWEIKEPTGIIAVPRPEGANP